MSGMIINKNTILQPYGKDDMAINLIVSHVGSWTFGLSDVDKISIYKENALVHSFIHIHVTNPKYYHVPLGKDYKLIEQKKSNRESLNHSYPEAEAMFFFLYYDEEAGVIAMNYTCDEPEYEALSKEISIISTYVVFGENFKIKEKNYSQAVEISKKEVIAAIESLKEESDV